jgi:DNA-binding IscR family transcriptional regulator
MTHELWTSLNAHIFTFLRGVSLAQLVQKQKKGEASPLQDHRLSTAPARATEPASIS